MPGLPIAGRCGGPCGVGGRLLKMVVYAGVPSLLLFAMVVVGMELTAKTISGGSPVSPVPSWRPPLGSLSRCP